MILIINSKIVVKMFEELPFMLIFLLFATSISYLLLNSTPPPLNKVMRALGVVGIVIHEICHLVACFITNAKVSNFKLIGRVRSQEVSGKKGYYDYGGSVTVNSEEKFSFLQSVVIGFAPLVVNFWLFFLILEQLFNPRISAEFFFLFFFLEISLMTGAAPSLSDIACIPSAFSNNPRYSLYQVVLLSASILIVWIISEAYPVYFIHEIVYYGFIMLSYYGLRYGFLAIDGLIYRLRPNRHPYHVNLNHKALMRKTHKPIKARKLGIEEAQW